MMTSVSVRAWFFAGLLACLGTAPLHAQTVLPDEQAREWMQCLSRGTETLVYPEPHRAIKSGGFVRVKLSFERADGPPQVEVLSRAIPEGLLDAVQAYLRQYRVPCLPAGKTVLAVQEFSFTPQSATEVNWSDVRGISNMRAEKVRQCMRTPPDTVRPNATSALASRLKQKDYGNLVLKMRFEAADRSPQITVVYDSVPPDFRQPVLDYVAQYRMPCVDEGGESITVQQQFHVNNSGSGKLMTLKDLDLATFLRAVKGLDQQKVNFDLGTMACPFELMWRVGMPIQKNEVGEVGARNLNRTEFMAWLAELSLNVPPEALEQLLGQSMVISVPCGAVKLGD
ncbi:hypothetical protein [Paucibacter sp. KCTC 42545]|uniref:hypothetical protein n=1 Tax=Paucibacter sp. KCTC 42545 TaxID=1768242 RepID=UPI000733B134|nr:hypothetical protein [Paucibacter sp. KCTC 42545]ALT78544.1 hypothetical protein AT984_16460 [Paucibacter sp. KCTC 42545]